MVNGSLHFFWLVYFLGGNGVFDWVSVDNAVYGGPSDSIIGFSVDKAVYRDPSDSNIGLLVYSGTSFIRNT